MTGFPIAIGVGPRHSSSRQFPPRPTSHKDGCHGDWLETTDNNDEEDEGNVIVAVGTNDSEDLMATVFIGYHFLPIPADEAPYDGTGNIIFSKSEKQDEQDSKDRPNSCSDDQNESPQRMEQQSSSKCGCRYHVLAELRVQISPTTAPFVSSEEAHMSSRETRCRVPLGVMVKNDNLQNESHITNCNNSKCSSFEPISLENEHINASVIISSTNSYLACLIPFPLGYSLAEGTSKSDWNEKYDTSEETTTTKSSDPTDASSAIPVRSNTTSTLVVFCIQKNSFTLDQQWRQRKRVLPPLPDYIVEKKGGISVDVQNQTGFSYDGDSIDLAGNSISTQRSDFSRNNSFVSQSNSISKGTRNDGDIRDKSTLTEGVTTENYSSKTASSASQNFDKSNGNHNGELISYVAHEPKIVRVHTTNDIHSHHGNESTVFSSTRTSKSLAEPDFADSNQNGFSQRKPSFGGTFNNRKSTVPPLQPLRCATCICDIPFGRHHGDRQSSNSGATSMLLVGTVDGSVLLVNYSLSQVQRVLVDVEEVRSLNKLIGNDAAAIDNEIDGNDLDSCCQIDEFRSKANNIMSCSPVIHLSQCPPTQWKPLDMYGEDPGSESTGRIAVIQRDGSVSVYTTEFAKTPHPTEASKTTISSPTENSSSSRGESNIAAEHSPGVRRTSKTNMKDDTTQLGLDIRILAIFDSRKESNPDNLSLRYIHAKWLKPSLLVLLTRSPHLDEIVLTGKRALPKLASSDTIVSQVWAVADSCCDEFGENEMNSSMLSPGRNPNIYTSSGARISLLSELRFPCGNEDAMEEHAHGTFAMYDTALVSTSTCGNFVFDGFCVQKKETIVSFSRNESSMSISYHRGIDCLAISSNIVKNEASSWRIKSRQIVCLWDWKRCARGLTLISSTSLENPLSRRNAARLSLLHLGKDSINGLSAVHIFEKVWKGVRRLQKVVFDLGTLSPPYVESSLGVDQPSAIIMQHDSVTFPAVSKSNTIDTTIHWVEYRIPPSYISINGPCRLAVIGKDCGKSVAVASSRGLCILDLSRMVHRQNNFPFKNDRNEPCVEGLVCNESELNVTSLPRWKLFNSIRGERNFQVVGMVWWARGAVGSAKGGRPDDLLLAVIKFLNGEPTQHLVCWSRKHLGFGQDQLLLDASDFMQENDLGDGDIGSRPGIPLPSGFRVDSMSIIQDPSETNRGSVKHGESNRAILLCSHTTCKPGGNSLVLYSVFQLQTKLSPRIKAEIVLGRLALKGNIPLVLNHSPHTITMDSINGIFLAGGSFSFHLDNETEPEVIGDGRFSITLGVTNIFEGLIAANVDCDGPIIHCPVTNGANTIVDDRSAPLIAAFWLIGNVKHFRNNNLYNVWSIGKNDGTNCSWTVPCDQSWTKADSFSKVISQKRSNNAEPHCGGMERFDSVGVVHHIGECSLWMNGAATNEDEIATGPFYSPLMSSTLYSGQMARKINQTITSYHVSDCVVAPPPETPTIFLTFLKIAELLSMSDDHSLDVSVSEIILRFSCQKYITCVA